MGDVTDEAEVKRIVAEARQVRGRIDILINNAAIRRQAKLN
jgi:3-oxoacyl-[acyl-carrier protein] reductase